MSSDTFGKSIFGDIASDAGEMRGVTELSLDTRRPRQSAN